MTANPVAPIGRAPYACIEALDHRTRAVPSPDAIDPDLSRAAERFLTAEARLLDAGRFEEWLTLWHDDGIFWIPLDPDRTEPPSVHQTLTVDDVARLHERVGRLRSPSGWSQAPATRTLRQVSMVEAWADGDAVEVRSVATIHHHRNGVTNQLPARQEHRLVSTPDGAWRIAVKVLDLLAPDIALPNISFLL